MTTSPSPPDPTQAKIPVAEMFYSLQGEGPTAGVPAVFLRTGGCNLLCGDPEDPDAPQEELEPNEESGATWVCDTIETWRNSSPTSVETIIESWENRGWLNLLQSGRAHLILTGGEPLLHESALIALLDEADVQVVEIETNGTIEPGSEMLYHVDHFNVSPKLSNSGMDEDDRINADALESFQEDIRSTFKFVVSDRDDLAEIYELIDDYQLPEKRVMLMPAGASQEQLNETKQFVAEACLEHNFEFCSRYQVDLWNQATGV